ncbi:MAG: endonuclease/exonuclease/phosphatase family protein [Verrucomicrobia bacterium]|nr:endonuclease/exonuclease/phosphatase family protein [Verrucomicrobiota bacterium]
MRLRPPSLALIALLLATVLPAADATALRVVSFNVRNSNAKDGEDAWPKRTDLFFDTIKTLDPDLIGFQEVLADQHDALVARMPGHTFAGVARNDGQRAGEWSCIAFRAARFTEIARGDFWLSETPEVPGSKSWDAALTRICSWVRLRDQRSGREFVYANTHFDHIGKVARYEASKLIARRVATLAAGAPALLTGDLNINEDNPAYAVLVRPESADAIRWIDAFRTVHPKRQPDEASFHGFKGTTQGSRIDFIFHSSHFVARASEIDRTVRNGRYPSDHYAVWAVIDWR